MKLRKVFILSAIFTVSLYLTACGDKSIATDTGISNGSLDIPISATPPVLTPADPQVTTPTTIDIAGAQNTALQNAANIGNCVRLALGRYSSLNSSTPDAQTELVANEADGFAVRCVQAMVTQNAQKYYRVAAMQNYFQRMTIALNSILAALPR